MRSAVIAVSIALGGWFYGCIAGYRLRGRALVDGVGWKSAEGFAFALFSASLVSYVLFPAAGLWALAAVLALWLAVQFFCHWFYTIFGASERKLRGYNECFRGTLRLFPESETRLVPDLYHIALHALILTDLILALCALFSC